jgi:hypothetical protein
MGSNKFDCLIKSLEEITEKKFPECFYDWVYEGCEIIKNPQDLGICECGQIGLRTIHYFSYESKQIKIGSKCVNKFSKYEGMENIVAKCKIEEKKMKLTDCKICGKKYSCDSKSKIFLKTIACEKCRYVRTGKVKCLGECGYNIPLEKDYYGNYKKVCKICYKKMKNGNIKNILNCKKN